MLHAVDCTDTESGVILRAGNAQESLFRACASKRGMLYSALLTAFNLPLIDRLSPAQAGRLQARVQRFQAPWSP